MLFGGSCTSSDSTPCRRSWGSSEYWLLTVCVHSCGGVHKRKESEAKELLQGASELNSCRVRVTLAQFAVREGDYAGAAEILQSTDGIRGTPAGTATVAALYERAGKPEKATKLIRAALDEVRKGGGGGDGKDSKTSAAQRMKYTATLLSAVAAMQMRQQKYQAAADTYGEIIAGSKDESARVAARANLVLACLHFDPARAAKEAEGGRGARFVPGEGARG